MRPVVSHPFELREAEAAALQIRLATRVITTDQLEKEVRLVAGVDVAYEIITDQVFSAVVVLDARTLRPIESTTYQGHATFDYVPTLFSFREIPAIVPAMEKLRSVPDLVICDGHGIAHPRRFGLASHFGVLYDLPTIGCAKTRLIGTSAIPGPGRGEVAELTDDDSVVGGVLRTQNNVRPVYVSTGHRVSLGTACQWVLRLSPKYRLPEPIRAANQLANELRRTRCEGMKR